MNKDKKGRVYIHIRNYQKWRVLDADYLKKIPLEDRNYYFKFCNEWVGGSFNVHKIHDDTYFIRKLFLIKENEEEYKEFQELHEYENFKINNYNNNLKKLRESYKIDANKRRKQIAIERKEYERALQSNSQKRIDKCIKKSQRSKKAYIKLRKTKNEILKKRKIRKEIDELEFCKIFIKRQTYQANTQAKNDFYFSRSINKEGEVSDDTEVLNTLTADKHAYAKSEDEFANNLYDAVKNEAELEYIKDELIHCLDAIYQENKELYLKKTMNDVNKIYDKVKFTNEVLEILKNKEKLKKVNEIELDLLKKNLPIFVKELKQKYSIIIYLLFISVNNIPHDIRVLLNKLDYLLNSNIQK